MRRPTIKDVAAHAGVSAATVSLVLRDSRQIPDGTKARVRASMVAVGYVYNRRAAEMRGAPSRTFGLVVANVRNPYFAELTMAVEERAHAEGYTLILGCSTDDAEREAEILRAMTEQRVDGIILLPASGTTPGDLDRALRSKGVPHVLVARNVPGYTCDYVGSDNEEGGRVVGEHLRELGARDVAFLGGVRRSVPRTDRIRGLMTGLAPDVTTLWADVPSVNDLGSRQTELVERALASGGLPDAIVAYNDMHAFGIMSALRARGIEPGRDVAIAGFDDVPEAADQYPSLTTADGFMRQVGVTATELLLDAVDDGVERVPRDVHIAPALRVRASTAESNLARDAPAAQSRPA